jgi:glycosyltransferase involved in cell wall biosynthesis
VDIPVVFSRFTQALVTAGIGKSPLLIYHGVELNTFRPDKRVIPISPQLSDGFIVGTVARNQQRKNLPALVRAFAEFARGKPDVLLLLHTQSHGDVNIPELLRRFDLQEKAVVTGDRSLDDAQLARLYNAMDLLVLPTMAEGFGLPIIESQACGVPALVTDCSACTELVPEPIQRLKVKDTLVMARNFEQAIVDVDDITAKLEHFYREPDELKALGQRCREFACKFQWSTACEQFVSLVDSLPLKRASIERNAPPLQANKSLFATKPIVIA